MGSFIQTLALSSNVIELLGPGAGGATPPRPGQRVSCHHLGLGSYLHSLAWWQTNQRRFWSVTPSALRIGMAQKVQIAAMVNMVINNKIMKIFLSKHKQTPLHRQ